MCSHLVNNIVICRFIAERTFGTQVSDSLREILNSVTGWEMSLEEVEAIGERIYTLERLMNVKRGVNRSKDTLPYRVMNEPIIDGPVKGRYCPEDALQTMLDTYYRLRGWNQEGIPTHEKLTELGIV